MKYLLLVFAFTFTAIASGNLFSQTEQNNDYQFFVDLNKTENDQLEITLVTPFINTNTAVYKLPAMVPGTYKVYNFGRYVQDFKAYDMTGNELNVSKTDLNSWEISDADKLYKLTYKIDDSFDDTSGIEVFEPVGTSIEEGKVFVVNNHGFFGYFSDMQISQYRITFSKPEGFFGSTSLEAILRNENEEVYTAPDYQFLVDNPIMFCIPDTITVRFDEANVLISVYSPGKGLKASDIALKLKDVLNAIRKYLGGKFTTDKYSFLFYFSENMGSGSFGALEHNLSSFYYMPDVPAENSPFMIKQLMSTSAHEFYHTVTPLNLHSEEIGYFDFNDPKMSKHLWLYEGVTEYNADYIQLLDGLIDLKEFVSTYEKKISTSANFNDTLPFTELSKGALDKYEHQYYNVYQKGALIGLCLDILIREESGGSMGLQDVINKLLLKYGKQNSFKDEELFGEITELTSPKIGEFFNRYVEGTEKIPYGEILGKIGIKVESIPYQKIAMGGGIDMGFNQKTFRLTVNNVEGSDNIFLKDLDIKNGDELISINGKNITFFNIKDAFGSVKNQIKKGDKFVLVVARDDGSGNYKEVTLNAVIPDTKTVYESKLSIEKNLTDKQKKLKAEWLGS
ncbi:MAG: peptidase M61 [Ignavibacteria bacterium]|nr:peptidase M61 [Ignavibacteria bacterium]